jgi:hypothetical protein
MVRLSSTKTRNIPMKQEVVKIFNDLEALHDFCRFELLPFNEADLYNRESHVWRSFEHSRRPKRPWNGEKKPWDGVRKPYLGKNPRPQYNNNRQES